MSFKIPNKFWREPVIRSLSPEAVSLYILAASYSADNSLFGFFPRSADLLAGDTDYAFELVDAGLWDGPMVVEGLGEGWFFHGWADRKTGSTAALGRADTGSAAAR